MFGHDDLRAFSDILKEEKGTAIRKEELLRDIEKELGRPETEIHGNLIDADIDYLCRIEGFKVPAFSDTEIKAKLKNIRKAMRASKKSGKRTMTFNFHKAVWAACIIIFVLISANSLLMKDTGKCLFSGIMSNRLCCSASLWAHGDNVPKSKVDSVAVLKSHALHG